MPKQIYVTPLRGMRVLDPATMPPAPLPETGKYVEDSSYWRRRKTTREVSITDGPGYVEVIPNTEAAGEDNAAKGKRSKVNGD